MTIPIRFVTTGLILLSASVAASTAQETTQAYPEQRVVIPFDFQSQFDDGRYGRMLGDMIWKKLDRRGRFVIPEAMLDVREWSERTRMIPNPETSLADMQRIVREDFGADIGIWGRVERVAGHEFDVYDVSIQIADFSGDTPRFVHQLQARTKTVSEIPHVYVKAALDHLYGVKAAEIPGPDPDKEERWQNGPNLVQGDFEQVGRQGPAGWDPLSEHINRIAHNSESAAINHVIRFQFPKHIAASSGVLYYSDFFPIEEGATYRFQCRWRTTGSAAKVFIKCYDELPSKYLGDDNLSQTQLREVYRSQQNLKGKPRAWNVHSEDFTPKHTQFTPQSGRVMLYGYWPAGTVEWDDVVVKQIAPPPSDQAPKIQRPSLETKVLTKELQSAQGNPPATPTIGV